MFTGIIQAIGQIARIEPRGGDVRLHIDAGSLDLSDVAPGDSIAVSGVCLTALEPSAHGFLADVSNETLGLTTLGDAVIKLWRSEIDSCLRTPDARCGQIFAINDAGITVACGDGALRLTELQRPGGKRLPAREFLRGFALAPGQRLGAAPSNEAPLP